MLLFLRRETETKYICLKKMKRRARNFLLREKAAAILRMQGIWKHCFSQWYQILNFYIAVFTDIQMKIERGNRVFPVSDHSSDVINGLEREMKKLGVKVHLNTKVKSVEGNEEGFREIVLSNGEKVTADACIVATGGCSYQPTGSTGDGYRMAESVGHTVTEVYPALVPLEIKEDFVGELQGLSLRNVEATIYDGKKEIYSDFGEMLFTHYGVSGPLMLSASSYITKKLQDREMKLVIDLKPALSEEQLNQRVLRDFEENKNKQFRNAITKLFPAKLIPVMVMLSGIDAEKKVNEVSKEERMEFVRLIKHFTLTINGTRSFREAIITQGGVKTKEVNPATMESKLVPNLYFVGEVLDLDALTGGFNLQIAWSTAYMAGSSIW